MTTLRPNSRAFTLIESVAAIVILAIAVPPMIWAIREAHAQRINPVLSSRARWLATEKLEEVIADRHSPPPRGWDYVVTGANYPNESAVSGFTDFSRTVTVTETTADLSTSSSSGGYKTVEVEVSWDNIDGATMTLAVSTVVTEYDS